MLFQELATYTRVTYVLLLFNLCTKIQVTDLYKYWTPCVSKTHWHYTVWTKHLGFA